MVTQIVDSWAKVPFVGLQIYKFNNSEDAFKYAKEEYEPWGYNVAFYSTDINTLFLTFTLNN